TNDFHSRENVKLVALGAGGGGDNSINASRSELMQTVNVTAAPARLLYSAEYGKNPTGLFTIVTKSGRNETESRQIALRQNFNALAVFAPSVRTDANGRAQLQVKLPDNLTRYRVMAVAVAGGRQFGSGESAITARLPLMARPSAPRFLNFGDRFELPIVLQNQTDNAMTVDVAVRAANSVLSEPPAVAGGLSRDELGVKTINRPLPQAVLT